VTGTAVRITNNSVDDVAPVAAWDGTHLGVTYARAISSTYSNLRFALLNSDATVASDVALTNYTTTGGMVDQADIEWNGSEYAIVWVERDTSSRVMFLRLDTTGAAKGAAIAVGTATALHSPAIAWSSTYGGYAIAYDSDESVSVGMVFRRIGATGSNPEAANTFDLNSTWLTGLDSAPDGSWALGTTTYSGVNFVLYNADGSRTAPVLNLTPYAATNSTGTPGLLHDGTAWTTTFTEQYSYKIFINRGTALNSPQPAVLPPANTAISDVILAKSNGALAIGWKQHPISNGTVSSLFRMQRFAIPSTLTSTLTPIHGPIDILGTQNIPGSRNIALVSAGTNAMIGVWADDRWGSAREIYAAPVDLMSCP
jgi:hypothetical protein